MRSEPKPSELDKQNLRSDARALEMLTRPQRRVLQLPSRGVQIALLDWGGSGPLALLHHATGFCKGIWAPIAEALSPRFRVIAMDARGHGDSSQLEGASAYTWPEFARDLEAVAEALAAEHGAVALGMGHSFGGTALLVAAKARPELFERLVLVDPVVPPPAEMLPPEHVAGPNTLAAGARRRRSEWPSRAEAHENWARRSVFARWQPTALDLYVLDGLHEHADGSVSLKCPGTVEAAIFEQGRHLDIAQIVESHPVPTLWLRAAGGNFPAAWCRSLASRMRACEFADVDAGHLMVMEQPDLVAEHALRFAAR